MSKYTPQDTLNNVRRRLWMDVRLIQLAEKDLGSETSVAQDCVEVETVLRLAVAEIEKIIRRIEAGEYKPRNIRQASDFALKAQLAKARQAVGSVIIRRPKEPSDK